MSILHWNINLENLHTMSHALVVSHPDHLTKQWAQRIVNQNDARVVVSKVNPISVDIGTTTRVRIEVEHDGPTTIPRFWFVKMPSLAWRARVITALPRLLSTEVRFYREIAPEVPISKPDVLAATSRLGCGSTLVLSDVTEFGAKPGLPSDALTVSQAELVVEQLAHLHARFWRVSNNVAHYPWMSGPTRRLEDHLGTALAVPLMKQGLQRSRSIVSNSLQRSALRYACHRRRTMHFLTQGPQTVVHHDCHPGNLFWQHSRPGLLDWQLVRTGEGVSDIAYFLATALTPEVRRRQELELLEKYVAVLASRGIDVELNKLIERYRAHLVYPFEAMVVTLAVGGMMANEDNLELIRRAAAAVEDLDAFTALPI